MTTTTRQTPLRDALRAIRDDAKQGRLAGYLGAVIHYHCDRGTLEVRNREVEDGGFLLGVYDVSLLDRRGLTIRSYEV